RGLGDGGHNAANINNRGIALGVAETADANPYYPNYNPEVTSFGPDPYITHVFEWNRGVLIELGALPGPNSSAASFIPENGLASGQSLNGNIGPLTGYPEANAVLWKDGQITNLGTLGGYESGAGQVNSHGQVTGVSANTVPDVYSFLGWGTQTRSFIWQNGRMQDLGTLGGPDTFAPFINESGQI